jgi:hypothetical protein
MPAFNISFMRVDRDQDPTIVESFIPAVDWPLLPREGEGLDIGENDPCDSSCTGREGVMLEQNRLTRRGPAQKARGGAERARHRVRGPRESTNVRSGLYG